MSGSLSRHSQDIGQKSKEKKKGKRSEGRGGEERGEEGRGRKGRELKGKEEKAFSFHHWHGNCWIMALPLQPLLTVTTAVYVGSILGPRTWDTLATDRKDSREEEVFRFVLFL